VNAPLPGWLAAELNGSGMNGPGAGWDPVWALELDGWLDLPVVVSEPGRLPAPRPRIARGRSGHGAGPAREAAA
jgi:hypothetical protein